MSLPQTTRLSDSFGSNAALRRDARAQQLEEFTPRTCAETQDNKGKISSPWPID